METDGGTFPFFAWAVKLLLLTLKKKQTCDVTEIELCHHGSFFPAHLSFASSTLSERLKRRMDIYSWSLSFFIYFV